MAHHKSAKKSIRKTIKQSAVNKNRRSRMRTFVKKVEESISAGDHAIAMEALKAAQPEIMRAAQKGIIKPNTASRKISRLNHRIKSLATAS